MEKKLILPEWERPNVPPSSCHYNRAVRESVWRWEQELCEIVDFESQIDQRLFFSYLCGRTEEMALIHKGEAAAAVPLDQLYSRIEAGWKLVNIPANHSELILNAAVTKPGYRNRVGESIPYKNETERAMIIGDLARRNYV